MRGICSPDNVHYTSYSATPTFPTRLPKPRSIPSRCYIPLSPSSPSFFRQKLQPNRSPYATHLPHPILPISTSLHLHLHPSRAPNPPPPPPGDIEPQTFSLNLGSTKTSIHQGSTISPVCSARFILVPDLQQREIQRPSLNLVQKPTLVRENFCKKKGRGGGKEEIGRRKLTTQHPPETATTPFSVPKSLHFPLLLLLLLLLILPHPPPLSPLPLPSSPLQPSYPTAYPPPTPRRTQTPFSTRPCARRRA